MTSASAFHKKRLIRWWSKSWKSSSRIFGSYARGNPRPESDVDLLVVMDAPMKESKQSLEIRRHLGVMFGMDLIVHTPKRLKERVDMDDWFIRDVLKDGKVLYESGSG